MYRDRRILALITARGGSKGLPRKNVLPLLGKPLVAWTVEQATHCQLIDRVIVSTDDTEIAEASRQAGADVPFMRPEELSRDQSTSMGVVFHALDWCAAVGDSYDYLVLLEPTSPLRRHDDLHRALELLIDREEGADAIVSLGEVHLENPFVMKVIKDGYLAPLMSAATTITQRQQYPQVFFPYGVIYASKVSSLHQHKTFYPERTIPFPISRWQNYEIDDRLDFLCVEAILKDKLQEVNP